jgi:replicative DNA helicase
MECVQEEVKTVENTLNTAPHSMEAEQSVIGAMMLDREAIVVVTEILKAEDFYKQSHKEMFEAILSLNEKGEPVDLITIIEELKQRGVLDVAGGVNYITDIANSVPTTANIKYYAKIVEEKAILRRLIKASNEILNISYGATEEIDFIIDKAEKLIFDIAENRAVGDFVAVKNVLIDYLDILNTLSTNQGKITGIPTGFTDMDSAMSGLQKSDLIIIAARPAMGKTAFALNIAKHAAIASGKPVAIFSLEMSKEQLVQRLISAQANVDSHKLSTGDLTDEDWSSITQAMAVLAKANLYIDDTPNVTVMEMRGKCRRLKLEKDLGLVVVDYLQLMSGSGKTESRQLEIAEISRSLKGLAKELNCPVIALSQLSRAPEMRADHRPVLSDLKESGSIEQDADIVMFLYRDDYYHPDSEKKNIAEVIISKYRAGSTGTIELAWLGQYVKFANLEKFRE